MTIINHSEHQWITMKDGVRLSARIWMPESAADAASNHRVAAILEYIPYRKRDMVRIRDERNHPVFAAAGYAAVRVDMRGSGDSEGVMPDMYAPAELDDAIAVIEWIAEQPWCNGAVGMMGTSWGGTSSLQAASRRPAALKAIVAVCANNNRYDDDIHHMGGCLLTDTVEWGATLPAILASPPDLHTVGTRWREIWLNRLEQTEFPLENWIAHETRDAYWQWGSVNERPDAITCPVLMIGGWADRYSNTVMNFLEESHDQCWGIVGPWGHHYPDQANPSPAIAFQQEAIRWWDHWLYGKDNGIDKAPKLRVWMQEYITPVNYIENRPGRWITEQHWPSAGLQEHIYYVGKTTLSRQQSTTDMRSKIPDDLRIGMASGDTGYFGRAGGLPLDQRKDDERALVFESGPIEEPLEVLGSITVKLALMRNEKSSMLVVRLSDVHPDGSVARVSYAVRNLALNQRSTEFDVAPLSELREVTLRLHHTAYRFAAGHRIRLAFSSSYWPIIWPSPQRVDMALLHDSVRLSLPIRTKKSEESVVFDPIDSQVNQLSTAQNHMMVSEPELKRWTHQPGSESSREPGSGPRRSLHWHQPLRSVFYPDINLTFGFETTAMHEIDDSDPTSAASRFEHTLLFTRDNWHVEVKCTAELTSTLTHFNLQGSLVVTENDSTLFSREWSPSVPRTCS